MYAPLVEAADQAVPILLVEQADGDMQNVAMPIPAGMSAAGALEAVAGVLRAQEFFPCAALFSAETFIRTMDDDGAWETGEAVVIVKVSGPDSWVSTTMFARTFEGEVEWRGTEDVSDGQGGVIDTLRSICGVHA